MSTQEKILALTKGMKLNTNTISFNQGQNLQQSSKINEIIKSFFTYFSITILIVASFMFCYYSLQIPKAYIKECFFIVVFLYILGLCIFLKGKIYLILNIKKKIPDEINRNINLLKIR